MFKNVQYDRNTFGITQLSLKMLRDTLAECINHEITVIEIPTSDITSGFLILDFNEKIVTFTGNGFRTDNCGEGGAGCRAALALFVIYGIDVIAWDITELWASDDAIRHQFLDIANQYVRDGYARQRIPKSYMPEYIDYIF